MRRLIMRSRCLSTVCVAGEGKINASFGELPRYFLRQASRGVADSDGPLFIVFRLEAEFRFEANRDGLVLPIDVHPRRDRSFADAEAGPNEKAGESFLDTVRDMDHGRDLLLRVGCILFILVPFVHVASPFSAPTFSRHVLADTTVVEKNHRFEKVAEHG